MQLLIALFSLLSFPHHHTLIECRIQNILRDRVIARQDCQVQARQWAQECPQQRERIPLDLCGVARALGLAARTGQWRSVLGQQATHDLCVMFLNRCKELLDELLGKTRDKERERKNRSHG